MKYQVHYTNFGYLAQDEFDTLDAAIAYGRSKGFEFQVMRGNKLLAFWTVFGGLREVA